MKTKIIIRMGLEFPHLFRCVKEQETTVQGISLKIVAASLFALVACTKVGDQAGSEVASKSKSRAGSNDREIEGYIVRSTDDGHYSAIMLDVIAVVFPVIELAYVTVTDGDDIEEANRHSLMSILLTVLDGSGVELEKSNAAGDLLVEFCSYDTARIGNENAAAVFLKEGSYYPPSGMSRTPEKLCFARLLSFLYGYPLRFIDTIAGATPNGFTISEPAAPVTNVLAAWSPSDDGAGFVTFVPPDGDAYKDTRFAVSFLAGLDAPTTCGVGVGKQSSIILAAGVTTTTFEGQDKTQPLSFAVCTMNAEGYASPPEVKTLEPAEAQAGSSTTSSSSSTSSTSSGGGDVECPQQGYVHEGVCYVIGYTGKNCTFTCGSHYADYSPGIETITKIGADGSNPVGLEENFNRCVEVLSHFEVSSDPFRYEGTGLGCSATGNFTMSPEFDQHFSTSLSFGSTDIRRVCACTKNQ